MLELLNFSLIAGKIATYCNMAMMSKFKVKGHVNLSYFLLIFFRHLISYQLVRVSIP